MKLLTHISTLSALMLFVSLFSGGASAYSTCSGCRVFGGYTVSGSNADSVGGYAAYVAGSSAYIVSGNTAQTAYGYGDRNDYCSVNYDPRYCSQGYYGGSYGPDVSGADYYVLGGAVYK